MSTVYIGHAVQDEHGKARGGDPGDQTGKEVCLREWYLNPKGWRVFRAKDPAVALSIAWDMKAACANPYIGYDQGDRNTLYNVAKLCGYDCARVTTPCEADCSSLVRVCILYAGIPVENFNTASEPKALLDTGAFIELTGPEYTDSPDRLKTGDLLVTSVKGHTCVVLNDGVKADLLPELNKYVLIKGGSVRVRKSYNTLSRTIAIVHRGEEYPYIETAPSGWYRIRINCGEGYVSNKPTLTEVIYDA